MYPPGDWPHSSGPQTPRPRLCLPGCQSARRKRWTSSQWSLPSLETHLTGTVTHVVSRSPKTCQPGAPSTPPCRAQTRAWGCGRTVSWKPAPGASTVGVLDTRGGDVAPGHADAPGAWARAVGSGRGRASSPLNRRQPPGDFAETGRGAKVTLWGSGWKEGRRRVPDDTAQLLSPPRAGPHWPELSARMPRPRVSPRAGTFSGRPVPRPAKLRCPGRDPKRARAGGAVPHFLPVLFL